MHQTIRKDLICIKEGKVNTKKDFLKIRTALDVVWINSSLITGKSSLDSILSCKFKMSIRCVKFKTRTCYRIVVLNFWCSCYKHFCSVEVFVKVDKKPTPQNHLKFIYCTLPNDLAQRGIL